MSEIPSTNFRESFDGNEYVVTGTVRLRSGKIIGEAELRAPKTAVDEVTVGKDAVQQLKEGLSQAAQALAKHDAKINGRWPTP
jgi:hypothetical protein